MDPNGYVPTAPAIRDIPQIRIPSTPKTIMDVGSIQEVVRNTGPDMVRHMENRLAGGMLEVAVPVMVHDRTWGLVRMGYVEK